MILTGNRCGHDPRAPQLRPTVCPEEGKGGLPPLLRLAAEKLAEYYNNPDLLPTLNAANRSSRQQKSERREACIRLLTALLHRMDIGSLRVGVPRGDQSFYDYTIEQLAEFTGLGLKRAKRALADLKRAGLVTVQQVRKRVGDGRFKSHASVKTLCRNLFAALGLGAMFSREHEKRAKRQRKNRRAQARASISAKSIMQQIAGGAKPATPRTEPKLDENRRRQELALMGELLQEHPDWGRDKIMSHIRKILDAKGV